jgi:hypothetical protein
MKSFLTLLVIVFAATSAWLWHELKLEQERERFAQIPVPATSSRPNKPGANPPLASGPRASLDPAQVDDHAGFDPERFKRGLVLAGRDPRLTGNQAYMDARRRYFEAAFDQRYPELKRVLDVPEETAIRVVELSYEEQLKDSGVTIDATAGRDFWLEQQQKAFDSDAAIAALIGDAKLARWKEYQASIVERHQVRFLRLELMDTTEPLDGDTAESLVRALYEGRQRAEREASASGGPTSSDAWQGPPLLLHDSAPLDEAVLERQALEAAKKVLSSFQYETYRRMVERQQESEDGLDEMFRIGMEVLE